MTVVLAITSALVIGASDFGGGLAAKREDSFRVTAGAQVWSLVGILALAVVIGADEVTARDAIAGAIGGLSGTFSLVCLYRALSMGAMGSLAPLTALVGATIPAVVGIARGDDLTPVNYAGLAIAGLAIVLVTREPAEGVRAPIPRAAYLLAITAGLGFAVFFIAIAATDDSAGMWPIVIARVVSSPVIIAVAVVRTGRAFPVDRGATRLAALVGLGEAIANALIIVALRRGPVSVATVVGSLYPVSTVLLAWLVLRERLVRIQLVGVGFTLVALALVAS